MKTLYPGVSNYRNMCHTSSRVKSTDFLHIFTAETREHEHTGLLFMLGGGWVSENTDSDSYCSLVTVQPLINLPKAICLH
jgi:hypothetical protein